MGYFDDSDPETVQLFDSLGSPVGEIGRGASGRLEARDNLNHLLGTYEESTNRCTDGMGITIGYGNWLPGLFDRTRK